MSWTAFCWKTRTGAAGCATAVSYTHLDVYKRQLYPKVHFLLHQGDYTTIPAWVRAGEIDFGFVNPDAESVRGLHTIFVTSGGHKAILHPDHPLAAQPWVTLEQLAKETFLLLEEGCLSEPLEAFRTLGLEPRVELRMHDNFSICSMVEANVGVSILPELALRKMNFRIVQLPTVPPVIRRVSLVMKDPDIPVSYTHLDVYKRQVPGVREEHRHALRGGAGGL